jgi:hypothetical protein
VKINTNLKRLIREYEFLLEDIDDVLEIHKAANQELNRAIRMAKEDDIAESEFEKEDEEEEVETFEDTPERKVLKSLFRKIVFKCHPDQLPKELSEIEKAKMQDLYEKAVIAHDRDNWGLMVVVAIKLDVKLPKEAEDMVGRISEETEGLKKQITQLTGSFAWQWYHAQEDLQKKMVSDYLNTLKMIKEKKALIINKPKKILVVGHPRTGTGYTAKLLQSWGLDVGHETMGEDGTSDWSLATRERSLWQDLNFGDYEWDTIIYCVRDPKDSIPSIVYTEDIKKDSFDYRVECGKFRPDENPIINAINSILTWDKLISDMKPNFTFKIESDHTLLFDFLKRRGYKLEWNEEQVGKRYNTREHKSYEELVQEVPYILSRFKTKINNYCKSLGYDEL